jgi:hypothetical protein
MAHPEPVQRDHFKALSYIIQCPTLQNHGEERIIPFNLRCSEGNNKLPDYYTIVPAVSIKQISSSVPEIDIPDNIYAMNAELQKEFSWTVHGINVIKEAKKKHTSGQDPTPRFKSIQ